MIKLGLDARFFHLLVSLTLSASSLTRLIIGFRKAGNGVSLFRLKPPFLCVLVTCGHTPTRLASLRAGCAPPPAARTHLYALWDVSPECARVGGGGAAPPLPSLVPSHPLG